jgi:DNA-binding CsgD family transcriptional regulator
MKHNGIQPKTLRNKEIVRLRIEGYTFSKLAIKYGISKTRVRSIYLHEVK